MHYSLYLFVGITFGCSFAFCSDEEEFCIVYKDGTSNCKKEEINTHKYTKEVNEEQNVDSEYLKNDDGLARREGMKIGHVEEVDVGHGQTVKVITRGMRPLAFEIPDFLTDEECDHIIKRAKDPSEGGMFSSRAKGGLTKPVQYNVTGERGKAGGHYNYFRQWDKNNDNVIEVNEIISQIHRHRHLILKEEDVRKLFKDIEETALDNDDVIDKDEFKNLNSLGMEDYLHILWTTDPRFQIRFSEQAWLHMEQWLDPMVHKIRERLVKLSGLSREIIYGGEQLQVVHYSPGGHYHAHHDSETHTKTEIPCCHQFHGDSLDSVGECKLCRYITFVMYLNDVEEGGDTAFPVADDATSYDPGEIRSHGNTLKDKYNLSHGCQRANLVVKPKKRQAVMWYNHLKNETDGWMGELDDYSLHGGCDVIKGEKWIANMWIPAPFGKAKGKQSIYLIQKDLDLAVEQAN